MNPMAAMTPRNFKNKSRTGTSTETTDLLERIRQGDAAAKSELFAHCYAELERQADARIYRNDFSANFDRTSLVHEVYLKLAGMGAIAAFDRGHFIAYAAQVMRSIIIDTFRSQTSEMHGGVDPHQSLDVDACESRSVDQTIHIDVHAAVKQLARIDPRLEQVAKLRYLAEFTDEQVAELLGLSERTVARDCKRVKAMLAELLQAYAPLFGGLNGTKRQTAAYFATAIQ